MNDSRGSAKDLLLSDLEQFAEALQRSEEIGERRFNFFLTLVTSVIAGLVVLHTSDKSRFSPEAVDTVVYVAVIGLLVFGVLTYLRLLQRNRVTDEFKHTVDHIRARLASEFHMGEYEVPLRISSRLKHFGGGLAQTVAVMNGALLGAFALLSGIDYRVAAALAAAVLLGGWHCADKQRKPKAPVKPATAGIAPKTKDRVAPAEYFRAGVGAVILNTEGDVLAIERADIPGAWQLPQGGLEAGESEVDAVYREIAEETGIARDRLKQRSKAAEPLIYELPPDKRSAKTGRGQVQHWFAFELVGDVDLADLPKGAEVKQMQWMQYAELLQTTVEFRRPVYRKLAQQFSL